MPRIGSIHGIWAFAALVSSLSCASTLPSFDQRQLPEAEQRILDRGETTIAPYLIGAAIGTYPLFYLPATLSEPEVIFALPGLGVGQLIQGRFLESGWIFAAGEAASILLGYGLSKVECPNGNNSPGCSDGPVKAVLAAAIPYAVFRIWEVIDLWVTPQVHNRQYYKLKGRMEPGPLTFFAAPTSDHSFALGAAYRF